MRSSKGTAQFLLIAFALLAALVYFSVKDADKDDQKRANAPHKQAARAAAAKANEDD